MPTPDQPVREIDREFLEAAGSGDLARAQDLVRRGANPLSRDYNASAMHVAIPAIALNWPKTRPLLEGLLAMGLTLNRNSPEDEQYGTPMHRLAWQVTNQHMQEGYQAVSAFIAEAVRYYGADLSVEKTTAGYSPDGASNTGQPRTVLDEFMRNAHMCPDVMKTLLTHSPALSNEQEQKLAHQWSQLSFSGAGTESMHDLLASGVRGDLLDEEIIRKNGMTAAALTAQSWQQHNTVLDGDSPHSKAEIFALSSYPMDSGVPGEPLEYPASPLLNPQNWKAMAALVDSCKAAGEEITAEDWLAPRINGMNALTIGVAYCGQPRAVMAVCDAAGLQLGPKELLDGTGKPSALLGAFIERHCVADIFSERNWSGQSKAALKQVYEALPPLSQEQIRNIHGLSLMLERENQHNRFMG